MPFKYPNKAEYNWIVNLFVSLTTNNFPLIEEKELVGIKIIRIKKILNLKKK